MPDALYNSEEILEISEKVIADLKRRALASQRKRYRLCMHWDEGDASQEMIIVFHRESFMPPHRHPHGKSESYHVIDGQMKVYLFDDDGVVFRNIDMAAKEAGSVFLYRLSASIWHMPRPVSEWVVYHETYPGPFSKEVDVEFPAWAPEERNRTEVERFLSSLPA